MTEDELEALYAEYLWCVFEIVEMEDQGTSSGARWDRTTALRDRTWQRYADAHGSRVPLHLDASAHRRAFQRGERSERVRELQERLGVEPRTGVYDDATSTALHRHQYATRWAGAGSHDEPPEPAGLVTTEPPAASSWLYPVAAGTQNTIALPPNTSGHWILALDPTTGRTAATTYNFATMASLAYNSRHRVMEFFRDLGSVDDREAHSRASVREIWLDGGRACSILRRVEIGQGYGTPVVIEHRATDTQLFMVECPQHILVAFRGSAPNPGGVDRGLHDFIRDANAFRVPYPYTSNDEEADFTADPERWIARAQSYHPLYPMEVHTGFLFSFHAVREAVYNFVRNAGPGPSKPVFITGHSLGGAVAVHAACYLKRKLASTSAPLVCYTFGQPRVGNLAFARHFEGAFTHFRVANIDDPVPTVPYTLFTPLDLITTRDPMTHTGHRYDCHYTSSGLRDPEISELTSTPRPSTVGDVTQHFMVHYREHCIADVWRALQAQHGHSFTPASSVVPLSDAALPSWETDRWEEHHHHGRVTHLGR